MKGCEQRTRDFTMGNWKMCLVQISKTALALVAKTERNLQLNLDVWQEEMSRRLTWIQMRKSRRPWRSHEIQCNTRSSWYDSYWNKSRVSNTLGLPSARTEGLIAAAGRLYHDVSRGFTGKREARKMIKLTVYRTPLRLTVQSRGH
jgi:hypothetical protein